MPWPASAPICWRGSRLSAAAAGLAGVVFAFGGYLALHRVHVPMHQAAAWLPWILWALDGYRRTGGWAWVAAAASFIGLHQLNGHTPTIALVGAACGIYLTYYTVVGPGPALDRRRFFLGTLTAGVLGCAAGLPQMLPMLEVARWSPFRGFHKDFLLDGYLRPRYLIGLASPWLFTRWQTSEIALGFYSLTEWGIFYGLLALPAALVGLGFFFSARGRADVPEGAAAPARQEAGFWLILAAANLCLMMGPALGLHLLLQFIPVYNLFHMLVRHVLVFGLALAWLAGYGLDALQRADPVLRGRLLRRAAWLFLPGLIGCLLGAWFTPGWPDGPPGLNYPPYWIALGSGVLAVLALAVLTRPGPRFRWLALLLPLAAYGELWFQLHHVNLSPAPGAAVNDPQKFPEPIRWLRARDDGRPARYLSQTDTQAPGLCGVTANGCCWGLSSLNTYSNSMPDTLTRLLHMDMYGQPDFPQVLEEERGLSAVGGKYVVSGDRLPALAPGLGFLLADRDQFSWSRNWRPIPCPARISYRQPAPAKPAPISCAGDYLVEGELRATGANPGAVRVRATVWRHNRFEVLEEQTLGRTDLASGRGRFCFRFRYQSEGPPCLQFEVDEGAALEVAQLDLWRLDPDWPGGLECPAEEAARQLRDNVQELYPAAVRFPSRGVRESPGP